MWSNKKIIILDVDGTLYSQRKLRVYMGKEIIFSFIQYPLITIREIRIMLSFRKYREALRGETWGHGYLNKKQYEVVAQHMKVKEEEVRRVVGKWIYILPLGYLSRCKYVGVENFIGLCKDRGKKIAVFSDYPSREKLVALGLWDLVDTVVSSTDQDVNAFKPCGRGLIKILDIFGIAPEDALYIGDRIDTDYGASNYAGVDFLLLGKNRDKAIPSVASYKEFLKKDEVL